MKTIKPLMDTKLVWEGSDIVSARAVREIRDKIMSWYGKGYFEIEPYLMEIGDTWETQSKYPVQGTWPKRAANWLYKKTQIRLTDEEKAIIGEIARRGMVKGTFYGRVVDRIDWDPGDFGDTNSCFWSDRSKARLIIPVNGGGAVQWFSDEDMCEGCSRALILPAHRRGLVLFNAYGSLSLEATADAISSTFRFGIPKQVEFTENRRKTDNDFWINGGKGILVPEVHISTRPRSVNLNLRQPRMCHNCGRFEPRIVFNLGEDYCNSCLEHAAICKHCGLRFLSAATIANVCNNCLIEHYKQCPVCDIWNPKESMPGEICSRCDEKVREAIQNTQYVQFQSLYELDSWKLSIPQTLRNYLGWLYRRSRVGGSRSWYNEWIRNNIFKSNEIPPADLKPGTIVNHVHYGKGIIIGKITRSSSGYAVYWEHHPVGLYNFNIITELTEDGIVPPNLDDSRLDIIGAEEITIVEEYTPITIEDAIVMQPRPLQVGDYVRYRHDLTNEYHYAKVVEAHNDVVIRVLDFGWRSSDEYDLDPEARYWTADPARIELLSRESIPLSVAIQLGAN